MTENGLSFLTDTYEFGSYAEGRVDLTVPWSDLEPYLTDPNLPKSLQASRP